VKKLHSLLYGRQGKAHETKMNIFKWNGLGSSNKAESKEKMTEKLTGWKIGELRTLTKLLCLGSSSSVTKEELVKLNSSFLVAPKLSKLHKKEKTASKKT